MGRQTLSPGSWCTAVAVGRHDGVCPHPPPLPAETPGSVVTVTAGPAGLVRQLRSRGSAGDVHLVGGPRTIQACYQHGALDNLEVAVLPLMLGEGVPLWPHGSQPPALRLLHEPQAFPDGSVELSYLTA